MKRQVLGVMAATVAAPYISAFLIDLPSYLMLIGGNHFDNPFGLFATSIVTGTFGLLYFGLPLLMLSSVMATILHFFRFRAQRHAIWSGCVLGFCFVTVLLTILSSDSPHAVIILIFATLGSVSGAICGWIYWLIAIKRTPPNGHAIEAA